PTSRVLRDPAACPSWRAVVRALQRAEDLQVLRAAARAVRVATDRGLLYGDVFSPLGDESIRLLALRLTVQVHYAPIGTRDLEAVVPPIYGRYVMVVSTDVDEPRRRFAVRHGLGHVAAGH